MTVKKINIIFKKISAIFLFAFCFQNLDVYGCKDCCDKCCEDCCKEASKKENKSENNTEENKENEDKNKENEDKNKEYYLVGGDLEGSEIIGWVFPKWYIEKKNKPVLKIFTKEENTTDNEAAKDKITIKDGKIKEDGEKAKQLKLDDKKYALFEITKKDEEDPIYLYCSDIESVEDDRNKCIYGIFPGRVDYTKISVIACDTVQYAKCYKYVWYVRILRAIKGFKARKFQYGEGYKYESYVL